MSASLAENQVNTLESVESILNELIRLTTEIADHQEDMIAKGVPFSTINAMVELAGKGVKNELEALQKSAVNISREKLGVGAISESKLKMHLDHLVILEEDRAYVRKVARGFDLNPMAINLLTQIVRQNPGDQGQQVLEAMLDYARTCGITINGAQPASNDADSTLKSVLPDIQIPQKPTRGLGYFRDLGIEVALGLLLAYSAIRLLT